MMMMIDDDDNDDDDVSNANLEGMGAISRYLNFHDNKARTMHIMSRIYNRY